MRLPVLADTEVKLRGSGSRNPAYEATLAVAARNLGRGGSPFVYLTLLGGGAFGNGPKWIEAAIERALSLYRFHALHVRIVHRSAHGPWMPAFQQLAARYRGKNELLRLRHLSWQVVADEDESEDEDEEPSPARTPVVREGLTTDGS